MLYSCTYMAAVGVKGIIRLESDRGCDVLVCIHAVINLYLLNQLLQ